MSGSSWVVEKLVTLPGELRDLPFHPADERVADWYGMEYSFGTIVAAAYLVITLVLRLAMPLKSAPFELYYYRLVHNFAMFAVSLYMFLEIMRLGITQGFFVELERNAQSLPMASVLWVFYISKIFEFNDTFIMLLRQKYSQVTFLHVYHHASVFWIWLLNVRIYPGTFAGAAAAANSFIHVLMYGYYFGSTFGYRPWWKKYLTQMQMFQFCFMICEGTYLTFFGHPKFRSLGALNGLYAVTLYFLFWNFYRHAYKKPKTKDQ
ncbi:GNS1/SUR4 family protein [Thecamonas trahens ATCC 50062]|uniref:Elongation of fatty acids protein n=1 Tax=Thecamonas trahens ATCC 50062 TaxID=461836 RepID=A0A0L0DQC8_THETB|nr:GNS1/SUR4 family protein [Thecamonas trahens ATCC 50062]KNC54507.1 GNS1/SUR4 family protein [Thecamonas trahens ATCC 50062]|eukprot:XP_013753660.1 GNS1/SUR4 family protein [Thecamonas trahens ATCC 50062]